MWVVNPHHPSTADCRHFHFKRKVLRRRVNTLCTGQPPLWPATFTAHISALCALNSWCLTLFSLTFPVSFPLHRGSHISLFYSVHMQKSQETNRPKQHNRPKPTKPKADYLLYQLRPFHLLKLNILNFEVKPAEKCITQHLQFSK